MFVPKPYQVFFSRGLGEGHSLKLKPFEQAAVFDKSGLRTFPVIALLS